MKRLRLIQCLPAVMAALLLPAPAAAGECPGSTCRAANLAYVTVGTVLRLTLDGSTMVTASPTQADYDAGYEAHSGPTALIKGNKAWRLQISAAQATWTPASTGARLDKPAADLSWSTSPEGDFTPVTTAPADVARGNPTRGTSLALFYRTRFDPTEDTPGIYTLVVTLTLVSD